jgi:sterol desaturase/sphingolipid hydroxylase (fatty acid hydroxylase superfamily)
MVSRLRQHLRNEIESPAENRRFGSGWLSGIIALVGSVTGLCATLCILFPDLLTTPQLRAPLSHAPVHPLVLCVLILSFGFAILSLLLREARILGFTAIAVVLATTLLGQFFAGATPGPGNAPVPYFGLDWFILNVLFTGILFIPVERLFPQRPGQPLFRQEWREDLFYYFISSMMVQILSFMTLLPSQLILARTHWEEFKVLVASQPVVAQFIEIMFLTDFVQYWVHRAFHRIPALWKFHAVHHSARSLDWIAGARMHFVEILFLRGLTVIPMMVLGFETRAVQAYILAVYIYSTFIHANVRWRFPLTSRYLVTPRFHHWHHGIEDEAVDVNFAIHFPLLDRLFGTYYMPAEQWPVGYGVGGHPVPPGYVAQFLYPFRSRRK